MTERLSRRRFLKLAGLCSFGLGSTCLGPSSGRSEPAKGESPFLSQEATREPTVQLAPTTQLAPEKPQEPQNLFEELIKPFVNEALKQRQERSENDPEFTKRVDQELNERRVNFLLFGWGETHEPPLTERAFIGSPSIISLDTRSGKVALISFTHDIRAPEIERFAGKVGTPTKISEAYKVGKFPLMQEVFENATGLCVDFQAVFGDAVIKDLVDEVFGGVEVEVPQDFEVFPFYFLGTKYPEGRFTAGKQEMDGLKVLQFIKTVPKSPEKSYEHNVRKQLVFEALLVSFREKTRDLIFWWRTLEFFKKKMETREIEHNFNMRDLVFHNIKTIIKGLGRSLFTDDQLNFPQISQKLYIVDWKHGDGGVRWVKAEASVNPVIKKEIEEGIYESLRKGAGDPYAIEIPEGGDPYTQDLTTGYWRSVRLLVKKALSQ